MEVLDLTLTLTRAAEGAPAEVLAELEMSCPRLGLPAVGSLINPFFPGERDELRWYLEEYWKWPFGQFKSRARVVESLLDRIGSRLHHNLHFDDHSASLLRSWSAYRATPRQVTIITDQATVLALPWELLRDEQGFLALQDPPVSIRRRLLRRTFESQVTDFVPPLRILLIAPRPTGVGFIDPRADSRLLLEALHDPIERGAIELEFLRPPTLEALRTRLGDRARRRVHVVHFDGHGLLGEKPEQMTGHKREAPCLEGMLAFEDTDGQLVLVTTEDLAQAMHGGEVSLALLDACQSATSDAQDALSSVAGRLIAGDTDLVIAMSASVLVASSALYVATFYQALANGLSAPHAHERARAALASDPRRHLVSHQEWREPDPVELCDWWVPQMYERRAVTLHRVAPEQAPRSGVLCLGLPQAPRVGFIGRARELFQIERRLWEKKLVVVSGFGGIGKTALAREAVDWLTRVGTYERACFVSFEHGGDACSLLVSLGHLLGVYDEHYDPQNIPTALHRLALAGAMRPTVVIIDNLETVTPGGKAALSPHRWLDLWHALLELSRSNVGVIVTCRNAHLGDGAMTNDSSVFHLELRGLDREDAYLLASRTLQRLGIDRSGVPYEDLRHLLERLDYHPLAIQLVLPAFHSHSASEIGRHLGDLLPQFVDEHETERNRSLLASLAYSLDRLDEQQQRMLARLAVFAGGGFEDAIQAITEMPPATWGNVRTALENTGLLVAERAGGNAPGAFVRFHPVLGPFLRRLAPDDPLRRLRHAGYYADFAERLSEADLRAPLDARPVAMRELPNFRSALMSFIDANQRERAARLSYLTLSFLHASGRWRERDALRQALSEVAGAPFLAGEADLLSDCLAQWGNAEDEQARGDSRAACARLTALIGRIEETDNGQTSYPRSVTLARLAECQTASGDAPAAEQRLLEALKVIDGVIRRDPTNPVLARHRSDVLLLLGNALYFQGQYDRARIAYAECLNVRTADGDVRGQAAVLGQLGTLELQQRSYDEATARYSWARDIFRQLSEPAMEATSWHQLGRVAEEQGDWQEAERCHRESLIIEEKLDNPGGTALSLTQLAVTAVNAGRSQEAEGWFRRALEVSAKTYPGTVQHGKALNNLAAFLVQQDLQTGTRQSQRLDEAQAHAQRALTIKEPLDASAETWTTLHILAEIGRIRGRPEDERKYSQRAREAYAAFRGNRVWMERQLGKFIEAVVAAARGHRQARSAVEKELRRKGGPIERAIKRIWAGEHDWHSLAAGQDPESALLLLLILERLSQ